MEEYQLEKQQENLEDIYYLKQKFLGILIAGIGIVTPIICNGDATISVIVLPLGIWLIFTKEKVLIDAEEIL